MSLRFSIALIAGAVFAASTLSHAATSATKALKKPESVSGAHLNELPARGTPIKGKLPVGVIEDSSIPTGTLAFLEASFGYCETIDHKSSTQYARLLNVILSGTPATEIRAEEATPDYAAALAAITARLKSASVSSGLRICRSALP